MQINQSLSLFTVISMMGAPSASTGMGKREHAICAHSWIQTFIGK